jgi:hypothetical protein
MILKITFYKRTDVWHILPAIVYVNDDDFEGFVFSFLCFGVGIYTLQVNPVKK